MGERTVKAYAETERYEAEATIRFWYEPASRFDPGDEGYEFIDGPVIYPTDTDADITELEQEARELLLQDAIDRIQEPDQDYEPEPPEHY